MESQPMSSEVSARTWRPSRRAVLAAAAAGGSAAAGARLVFGQPQPPQSSKAGTQHRADWPVPADQERARIAQLLRRATWGVTAQRLDTALHDGFARTVDRLIDSPPAEPKASPIAPDDPTRGALLQSEDYQRWWLTQILNTSTPFAEKMAYFWHGHFTSDYDKGGAPYIYWQNLTWRRMALGRLGEMLHKVTLDPAMLNYLDLGSSDASDPAVPPNENYARELMELFTMGAGTHSERDVKAAAKALAGWSLPEPDGQVEVVVDEKTGARETYDYHREPKAGYFDASRAHDGVVTFLGRTGRLQLKDVIDQILAQPITAGYIARRVAIHFISPKPAGETVSQIADAYRSSDYDTRALMRAVFMSPEFSAPSSYRSLVRSPVEFMVAALLALQIPVQPAADMIIGYGDPAGQSLFQPPNVAGWPPNARWISPGMLLARFNFVSDLTSGDSLPTPPASHGAEAVHLDGVLGDGTSRRLAAAHGDRERWLAILSAPEFQLK
jgi:uncharacterized protein (DUF1800 family)